MQKKRPVFAPVFFFVPQQSAPHPTRHHRHTFFCFISKETIPKTMTCWLKEGGHSCPPTKLLTANNVKFDSQGFNDGLENPSPVEGKAFQNFVSVSTPLASPCQLSYIPACFCYSLACRIFYFASPAPHASLLSETGHGIDHLKTHAHAKNSETGVALQSAR